MGIHAPAGGHRDPIDWDALRREILGRLNIVDEYKALGVEFTGSTTRTSGWRECRAIGREDKKPSAAVNVLSGVYKADGEAAEVLGFFAFAAKYGKHGDWLATHEHYADKAGVPLPFAPKEGEKGRIEAVYPYHNDAGRVVYEVVRYRRDDGTKTFRQRRPDGKGGHVPNIEGVTPVPYRLPDLLSGDRDDPVWIVEGEKDADRLAAEGLAATTAHGGTGNTKVWEKIAGYLEGRDVYVIPDNDASGLKHAHGIAAYLVTVARTIKVVELPGLNHKGDMSDWLDAGGTIEALGQLGFGAPSWSATTAPGGDDLDRDCTVADLRQTMSDASWVWLQWIPNAALTLVAAEAGVGKTRFCFDLHRRIFHGTDWPDDSPATMPPGSPALWIVADNQHQEICDLAREFGIPDDMVIINTTAGDPYGGTSLQTAEELADFEARIRRVRPCLVVIDTITNTGDFKAQDSSDAKRQYKPLQEIAIRCQVPILCVTHLNAGGKVLGRRAVEKVRVVIQLDCPDPDGQPNRRKLWVSKSKAIRPAPLGATMGDAGNQYDTDPPVAPEGAEGGGFRGGNGAPPPRLQECMDWLTALLRASGTTRVSVIRRAAEQVQYSSKTIYAARDRLGVVETEDDGKKWWQLPDRNGDAEINF